MRAVVIHCTCPNAAAADRIATALVEERLAACVQQLPGLRSTYRWAGRVEHADEVLLLIKTAADRIQAVFERVTALHPHDVPELLALDAQGGTPAYLDWVNAQSRDDA
ncbi:divalent-cation tolerance protein CutA [Cognatilysobacter lacus]|uniref:Divalent-cation tolerance protein CutA n=1 Tax=Cognatilysobacter lacus TaxID=1643323 RepID=A0A5D8YZ99_9GAMM|nr:divalent-cation tolerance protein CutA [Lysobacter lacus]TZF88045.1 divalent-cation tolerance protein CutA [Lysobacter lacus]